MATQTKTAIRKGTTFFAMYADSKPQWKVVSSRGPRAWDCIVVSDDWNGHVKVFGSEEIADAIEAKRRQTSSFKKSGDFYSNLNVGEIVHYHDAHGRYVRCRVINEKGKNLLQPIALVGNWTAIDLPKRRFDGSINNGHHGEKIINKTGAWQPHDSCVWESDSFTRTLKDRQHNPAFMPEKSLIVPEMTAEEARAAALQKLRMDGIALLGDGFNDPAGALKKLTKMIEDAGIK